LDADQVTLAVNCGSSSVKIALFDAHFTRIGEAEASRIATDRPVSIRSRGLADAETEELPAGSTHADAIGHLSRAVAERFAGRLVGIGHRVVHGGAHFAAPRRIDAGLVGEMEALTALAPLHQPHNLTGIRLFGEAFPGVPQVACFDTAFHRTIPEKRQRYGLPPEFAEKGLRAYGFHGLSCTHAVTRFEAITGRARPETLVIAHLGNGASVTGVREGRSVYNSMGFTPIDGLIMGQRSGHLDPGAVLWLVDEMKGDTAAVSDLLNRKSGLLGLSGESSDMRTLLESTSGRAALALDMFVDRVVHEIAAAAASAGGLDALVFTGGIGSGSSIIRARVLEALAWLGFEIDPQANGKGAATITTPASPRSAHVVIADEEQVIARAVADLE
jgi:acetate kinase